MLDDLNIKLVRIPAYWNLTEPKKDEYNFEALDFQLDEAQKHGAKVMLAVGRRLPRWPECHEPGWFWEMPQGSDQDNAQLSYVETVVSRYASHPAVTSWQVGERALSGRLWRMPQAEFGNAGQGNPAGKEH